MYSEGDIPQRFSGENYLRDALGKDGLRETSPVNLAGRIKVPIFLAAGGEDQRTPLKQSEAMERALKAAGVPVETLVYPDEGHGFYVPAHQIEFQTRLLAFFDRHIGNDARKSETERDQGVEAVAGD
jgi:dipeptidyl aminopeptidase/acylaminoacyl peptidase